VPDHLKGKQRTALSDLISFLDKRQGLIIEGLRRVGKTTLMHQLINYLLNTKVNPLHILYFTFDEEVEYLDKILDEYEKLYLKSNLDGKKIFIFLDEIHKLKSWQDKLKIYYDYHPEIKFIISGSTSPVIEKNAKESLAGRFFSFKLKPLTFKEFLVFRGFDVDYQKIDFFKKELDIEFYQYIKTSGFVEVITEEDDSFIQKYFNETVSERIVYKDVPQAFGIDEPDLLKTMFSLVCYEPGSLINYDSLGNDLKRDRRTIQKYFTYLNSSFLIKTLYNYSSNQLIKHKKNKKIYPAFSSFIFAKNPDLLVNKSKLGRALETVILQEQEPTMYFRNPQKVEVDFIINYQGKETPLEVKFTNKIERKDFNPILNFMRQFGMVNGLMITEWLEDDICIDGRRIQVIPLVKFLLNRAP